MGSPFRAFPSRAAVATSRWPVPSCRYRLPCKHDRLPAFRALLHARVRCRPPMFPSGRPARCSPGLHPLQGSHPPRRDLAFTKSPLQRPAATVMWEHTQLTLAGLFCRPLRAPSKLDTRSRRQPSFRVSTNEEAGSSLSRFADPPEVLEPSDQPLPKKKLTSLVRV